MVRRSMEPAWDSKRARSTCTPRPLRSAVVSAATVARAAIAPPWQWVWCPASFTGSRSLIPVAHIGPAMA